ncbi:Sodium/potassium-transporting ATPase subunit beta-1-interacting protein [Halotydeus destructor]|nr:Sodium/potassium-transporting ATPase subunit beta-1-interacting protein [Halotydeus destructor]
MACCTVRHLLMTIITFQLVLTIIRQVFDFLGQMWAPILFNFVATLVIIIGLFGAFYNRKSYVAIFLIWQLIAIAWNSFVAAFYLEVGHMSMSRRRSKPGHRK